ncbi:HTTM domain-containing protein [Deminuibacter soli]|uniref:HTTM-like domain-containing protein n=1 Tax=Deminuibacter soli TaxID=2291815 RepID=A0A3E1NEM4_9BACT|nr:HTTM domain-containing protein [Deminuibacter soli]RFM26433.1 hypothetical protein DXN05_19580 [Deminuibacter soli]
MFSLQQLSDAWNTFFFTPEPVYTIALFRIVFGLILLYDSFFIWANALEYLGPQGLLGYERYQQRYHKKSLSLFLYLPPTPLAVHAVLAFHVFFLVMMILGIFTTISVMAVFITLNSIINRNVSLCNGGDNLSRIMCFLLIFTPCGQAWSADQWWQHHQFITPGYITMQAPWALRLMQIQVSIIYLYTVYWKLKGATYRKGIAMYYITANDVYRRYRVPRFLLQKPFVQILTWGALIIEFALGIGLWIKEVQYIFLVIGYLFHLAIEYMLNIHLFGWHMLAVLLLFANPVDVYHVIGSWLA